MNEKLIEKKLREGAKKMGGIALKFISPYFTGIPDRLVLIPKGKIYFVELKSTGKKPSPRQEKVKALLEKLGFRVFVIDSQKGLDDFWEVISNEV